MRRKCPGLKSITEATGGVNFDAAVEERSVLAEAIPSGVGDGTEVRMLA